ncbi:MAG: SDR family NAD(P)-dependent oxidoreductase, partial [Saprospiraceae bacterium]
MQNKVAVITGGNGTLGSAFAKGLAEAGATVYILGRNEEKSTKKVAEFKAMGLEIHALQCDVLDEKSVHQAADT